jgi:integrase
MARGTKKVAEPKTRERGQVIARGAGKWLVRVSLPADASGARRTAAETVHGSRRDAEKVKTRMLAEVDAGTFVAPNRQTLGDYLTDWLEHTVRINVSGRTHRDHTENLKRYVFPRLGNVRLDQLTPQHVQRLYSTLAQRGLSTTTIRLVRAPLHQALKQAAAFGLISKNPAEHVKPPKAKRKEMQALTPDEVGRFLVAAREDKLYALWFLLLTTGLRPQEARALRWTDLEGDQLRIQRALSQVSAGRSEIASTKRERSNRTVILPPMLVSTLAEHRQRQREEILRRGPTYRRAGLMFANSTGTPLQHTRIYKRWKALLEKAGLPPVRLYDARHTHATCLLAEGVNAKLVQERLGHASVALTLNIYSHVLPTMQREVADRVEQMLAALPLAS